MGPQQAILSLSATAPRRYPNHSDCRLLHERCPEKDDDVLAGYSNCNERYLVNDSVLRRMRAPSFPPCETQCSNQQVIHEQKEGYCGSMAENPSISCRKTKVAADLLPLTKDPSSFYFIMYPASCSSSSSRNAKKILRMDKTLFSSSQACTGDATARTSNVSSRLRMAGLSQILLPFHEGSSPCGCDDVASPNMGGTERNDDQSCRRLLPTTIPSNKENDSSRGHVVGTKRSHQSSMAFSVSTPTRTKMMKRCMAFTSMNSFLS